MLLVLCFRKEEKTKKERKQPCLGFSRPLLCHSNSALGSRARLEVICSLFCSHCQKTERIRSPGENSSVCCLTLCSGLCVWVFDLHHTNALLQEGIGGAERMNEQCSCRCSWFAVLVFLREKLCGIGLIAHCRSQSCGRHNMRCVQLVLCQPPTLTSALAREHHLLSQCQCGGTCLCPRTGKKQRLAAHSVTWDTF